MFDYPKIADLALSCGFTDVGELLVSTLKFLPEVRDMCAVDKCGRYDKSWACPPACGTLEEMTEKVASFERGIIVQTVGQLEDSFDFEGIQDAAARQADSFAKLWDALRPDYTLFPMGSGGCARCEKCTYPDAPCRYPDSVAASMEACGLVVSQTCTDNGVKYNYGKDTIAFTACFLIK
jgi:predicted metal-binding protein